MSKDDRKQPELDRKQSELARKFSEKYKNREPWVEVNKKSHYGDPKPTAIKDKSNKKIASYEIKMVRWSRPLLHA